MQLIYLIEIFEYNYNTVLDINSVNAMKKRPLAAKKQMKISVYISLAQSIKKP